VQFASPKRRGEWTESARYAAPPLERRARASDVEAEAARRLRAIKLDEWRTREFITGRPVPEDVRHIALQIEFAAKAIERLAPIPADYASDVYWPRMWERP